MMAPNFTAQAAEVLFPDWEEEEEDDDDDGVEEDDDAECEDPTRRMRRSIRNFEVRPFGWIVRYRARSYKAACLWLLGARGCNS
jgi:hypothetical protein